MEPKSSDRSKSTICPSDNNNNIIDEKEDDLSPMQMARKGRTTTLKGFLNDEMKCKLAEKNNHQDV